MLPSRNGYEDTNEKQLGPELKMVTGKQIGGKLRIRCRAGFSLIEFQFGVTNVGVGFFTTEVTEFHRGDFIFRRTLGLLR